MKKSLIALFAFGCFATYGVIITNYQDRTTIIAADRFTIFNAAETNMYNVPYSTLSNQLNTAISGPLANMIASVSNTAANGVTAAVTNQWRVDATNAALAAALNATNTLSAQYASQLSSLSPPFVTVSTNGTFVGGGAFHDVSATTTTCGIQEAIYWLLKGTNNTRGSGGTLFLGPGTFITTKTINIPGTHFGTNMVSIQLQGSGKMSSGITYVGPETNNVMLVNPTNSMAGFNGFWGSDLICFSMSDMFMSSTVNGCTNILYIKAPFLGFGHTGQEGTIEAVNINRCLFFFGALTNYAWGYNTDVHYQENLIAVNVDVSYDDHINIRDNTFAATACGISYACDWGSIEGNIFGCQQYPQTNAWPASSPYYLGANIVFKYDSGGATANGCQWYIAGNAFIGPTVAYFLDTHWDGTLPNISISTYNDTVEPSGSLPFPTPMLVTIGDKMTFINPRIHGMGGSFPPFDNGLGGGTPIPGYIITNNIGIAQYTWDFSNWRNTLITSVATNSQLYSVVDLTRPTLTTHNLFTTNTPTNGQVLTFNGTNMYWKTP